MNKMITGYGQWFGLDLDTTRKVLSAIFTLEKIDDTYLFISHVTHNDNIQQLLQKNNFCLTSHDSKKDVYMEKSGWKLEIHHDDLTDTSPWGGSAFLRYNTNAVAQFLWRNE